ncbi:diguanylate cyclase domain-containing protein [Rhodoferax saidenbachensis]|uniref:diguanylate cyclase n=1 Tax=Rhodoferax saidenbachensis TaxID=1484693 RepID=A0ABU1ZNN2_9BURK|nr:diguanylate cyclase [Rhodoferax saidenbachensis]MDR7307161.1 diguanylate cyclase (GGDEF)-like protein [Rhodoferax saidenbachensis]
MNAPATHTAALLDSTHGKPKLLVVDDQPINIQLLVQAFAEDYQVFMATSGEQALAVCQSNPPDLVLLDVLMPGMDGFAVCRQLKAQESTSHIPIIFVTARPDAGQETHGLGLGAVDFISKPVNPAVVRARVHTHLTLKFQSDLLKKLVLLDGLSGVFNRRYFDQQLATEWARAARSGLSLSLVLLDVDHFGAYNERHGHQAGDDCLRLIAVTLKAVLRRPADVVARFGGEEFACLLPDTSHEDALALAQEMERRVRQLKLPRGGADGSDVVSVSVGLGTRVSPHSGQAGDLLALATQQLQQAKHSGRGQVRYASLNTAPMPL